MNLREAILSGSRRLRRRATGIFLTQVDDDEYAACALGAAYVGCHSDVPLSEIDNESIHRWVSQLGIDRARHRDRTFARAWTSVVYEANDNYAPRLRANVEDVDADWQETVDRLHEYVTEDGTPLDKVEVCDLDVERQDQLDSGDV